MMTPVGRLILLRSFPRSGLVSAMNWMTIPAMIGPTVGPIVGGFLTTYFSWRAIFYLNVPIGIAGVVLALWLDREFPRAGADPVRSARLCIAGLGLAFCSKSRSKISGARSSRRPSACVSFRPPSPSCWSILLACAAARGSDPRSAACCASAPFASAP